MITTLQARFDSRKSFCGKAIVITKENAIYLQSYDTIVARYDADTKTLNVLDTSFANERGVYTATTRRHIKEFALQLGFDKDTKYRVGVYTKQ